MIILEAIQDAMSKRLIHHIEEYEDGTVLYITLDGSRTDEWRFKSVINSMKPSEVRIIFKYYRWYHRLGGKLMSVIGRKSKTRGTWDINPTTRIKESKKKYNRSKSKQEVRKGVENVKGY